MPERLLAPAAMAALLCLTTTAISAETSDTMSAEQGWSSIKRCAQEDTERGRHACLDRVLREAGVLTDEMHTRQQRRAFGLEDKPVRAPTPPAPVTAPATVAPSVAARSAAAPAAPATNATASPGTTASSPAQAASAPPAPADRLDVEIAKVEKAVNGRIFVTTTDGAVWLQNETVDMPLPPVAGDHMTIRKGSVGGYRCTVASTHLTYRCIRNR